MDTDVQHQVLLSNNQLPVRTILLGVFVTFRLNVFLHKHYHLIDTPFERFAWFRRKRELHFVHHRDARYNFAVIEFWIDDLLGTKKDLPHG